MQQSLSVILERNTLLTGEFATEPYEVAWAREARWFVRLLEFRGTQTRLEATTQISPDGLQWCDLDDCKVSLRDPGLVSWVVREFGGWLRLKGVVAGDGEAREGVAAKVLIYLVLKG
ncbi:MAG: hypothetical protein H0U16_01075 [Actinobacteria bacterium]|nr:hypothetical protein [Actinomycetota bacterium]